MTSPSQFFAETDRVSPAERIWQTTAGLLAGAGISLLILFALAVAQHVKVDEVVSDFEDLRSVALPPPPPPPRPIVTSSQQPPAELVLPPSGESNADEVRVAMAQPRPMDRPDVAPMLDLSPDTFRVQTKGQGQAGYVYEPTEVDQQAMAIRQVAPNVNTRLLDKAKHDRVILLFMVDENGRPQNLRVLQSIHRELDSEVVKAVRQWLFKPASKEGRPVRQWVMQSIIITAREASPFSI